MKKLMVVIGCGVCVLFAGATTETGKKALDAILLLSKHKIFSEDEDITPENRSRLQILLQRLGLSSLNEDEPGENQDFSISKY